MKWQLCQTGINYQLQYKIMSIFEKLGSLANATNTVETSTLRPDFSNLHIGTPLEVPILMAKGRYETARDNGQLTPELEKEMAIFTKVSKDLVGVWRAEQEAAIT